MPAKIKREKIDAIKAALLGGEKIRDVSARLGVDHRIVREVYDAVCPLGLWLCSIQGALGRGVRAARLGGPVERYRSAWAQVVAELDVDPRRYPTDRPTEPEVYDTTLLINGMYPPGVFRRDLRIYTNDEVCAGEHIQGREVAA